MTIPFSHLIHDIQRLLASKKQQAASHLFLWKPFSYHRRPLMVQPLRHQLFGLYLLPLTLFLRAVRLAEVGIVSVGSLRAGC
jgi:hypothetical protein